MIIWCILAVFFCLFLLNELYTFKTGVPTIASFPRSRQKIVEALRKYGAERIVSGDFSIVDLGSGNGQLADKIARAFPKAKVLGIEISFVPCLLSKLRRKLFGPANLEFQRLDFWPYDCSRVDAIVLYANGAIIERVSDKLRKELKTGALVVTNEIPLTGNWQPVEIMDTNFFKMKVFIYRQA